MQCLDSLSQCLQRGTRPRALHPGKPAVEGEHAGDREIPDVVPRAAPPRGRSLSESGDAADDEALVEAGRQQLLEHAGAEAFDQDVGARDEGGEVG